jgi:hypothetical protein
MKRAIAACLYIYPGLQALAHEGHGVDTGSFLHYFAWPHLLPAGIALCALGACYAAFRYFRQRR